VGERNGVGEGDLQGERKMKATVSKRCLIATTKALEERERLLLGRGSASGRRQRRERTYTSSLLLLDSDLWRLLVQTDTETFELGLDDLEISEGLENVENDEDELRKRGTGKRKEVSFSFTHFTSRRVDHERKVG